MTSKEAAQLMLDLKEGCEKIAAEREERTHQKCAQVILAASGLELLRQKMIGR